jgi:carbon monoxide dehydrogenase subunit G
MKISGTATLHAGVDEVYAALIDPAVLVRTIPGCQRLEQVGADAYQATIMAGIAAIKGTFDGAVRLTDLAAPHSFTLVASGVGAPGVVSATARVTLADGGAGTTRLSYEADATVGGVIGGVGQRMIVGVARRTADDFFAAVDRELTAGPVPGEPSPGVETASASPDPAAAAKAPTVEASHRPAPAVWTAPAATPDPTRQRVRDLMAGAVFGVVVALLGVLVGAIIVGWK